MEREIINNALRTEREDNQQENLAASSPNRTPEDIFIDRTLTSETDVTHVNGHYLPDEDDEDEDQEEDDLVLGDEDDLDDEDLDEDEIDVEVDDEIDEYDLDEDDLVLDTDDDEQDEDEM